MKLTKCSLWHISIQMLKIPELGRRKVLGVRIKGQGPQAIGFSFVLLIPMASFFPEMFVFGA